MRNSVSCVRAKMLARVAVVALLSGGAAACSSDTGRFGEGPFSNPFNSASAEPAPSRARRAPEPAYTGAVQRVPTSRVERAPLGALPPAQAAPMRGFEGQQQPYRSSAVSEPATTGSLPPVHRPQTARVATSSNWTAEGGSTVTLAPGETVQTLSQRYGVPATAILQANNLPNASSVGAGSQVVIPVYSTAPSRVAAAAPSLPAPQAAAPRVAQAPAMSAPAAAGGSHTVQPGETLSSIGRTYGATRTDLAAANGISPDTMVRIGQKLVIPGRSAQQMAAIQRTQAQARAAEAPAATGAVGQPRMQFVQGPQGHGAQAAGQPAAAKPMQTAQALAQKPGAPALKPSVAAPSAPAFAAAPSKATSAPEPAEAAKPAALKVDPAPAASNGPNFRWPVRGRVVSNFGSKASGSTNDGINLAVPEGTEVKASDDGVVAYAGDQLKNFGNLVLIRHSNGWVTAYAHNSALNVKRGDTVRRGQIIAKSGSTGSVSSPQLHFEVRKGAQAVDPMDHLAGI
ncbi:murein DD-endopeptidase MepM/ murein hydrolase activator NlpD [Methylopila jiangsuensis]|nr:LysM peptidoglycan-binding domain-containing M23 family metallopeptidase [Methylopila jiangsuensis]MDR6286170.1 murein DD-endopeptidase MepM/ murein hydrolase activator NlpD [Methylopila jiangsuensis]